MTWSAASSAFRTRATTPAAMVLRRPPEDRGEGGAEREQLEQPGARAKGQGGSGHRPHDQERQHIEQGVCMLDRVTGSTPVTRRS